MSSVPFSRSEAFACLSDRSISVQSSSSFRSQGAKPRIALPSKLRLAPPKLRLTPSVHFAEQLNDRRFDLSILVPAYQAMVGVPIGTEKEFSIGRSSVVAVKTSDNEAILKTGWRGNRRKR
jgi:hypothetical protein